MGRRKPRVPKTVKIPFLDKMVELILAGKKTATTRPRRYGQVGDCFEVQGRAMVLTKVSFMQLDSVANYYYREEGFESPGDFMATWNELHPGMKYDPHRKVYFHTFCSQAEYYEPHVHHFTFFGECEICGMRPQDLKYHPAYREKGEEQIRW